MEQRDPESGAAEEPTPAAAEPGDIELAAAAAVAEAEQPDPADAGARGPGWTAALSGLIGTGAGGHGPRRWTVVAAVAVTAVALATTAAAVSMRSSSNDHPAVAGVDQSQTVDQTPTTPQSDLTTTGTPSASGTSDSASQTAITSPASPAPSSASKTPAPATSSKPSVPVGSNETDCENSSHETPQDAAMKFSGMTKGTQSAFLAAQSAAKEAGIASFVLNSGYRSAAYQQRIYDCWVKQLGSPQAARQYALPPNQSAHVAGYAMDIAPQNAAAWLESTAGKYGLCRRYVDEPWHFEYQAAYKTKGCPALLPQP